MFIELRQQYHDQMYLIQLQNIDFLGDRFEGAEELKGIIGSYQNSTEIRKSEIHLFEFCPISGDWGK